MTANTYLLDTHCLLWFQGNNPNIPQRVIAKIQDPDNIILFSQISLFEVAIKQTIGKLPDLTSSVNDIYDQAIQDSFTFLPVYNRHIYGYGKLPLLDEHRDPFDRLLIAAAIEENAVILTVDKSFRLYKGNVSVEW